ncbi:MAG: hypothetical protein DRI97_03905 [Bacteroidetes bacterium]|nr:MAG: hypothetical protein DRQ42_00420 [Gammaproteobacteria bacterium]RLD58099.1 MAG: hypothetical protein DRI97_03905 [Bacteroidota bacterium]
MKVETIKYASITDEAPEEMTGDEDYPVIGNSMSSGNRREILKKFKGLNPYWNCIDKAGIVQRVFGGIVVLGAFDVFDEIGEYSYGFDYKPPYMFHAWVEKYGEIFDFALPGVLEIARKTIESINRESVILTGVPPSWLHYSPCHVMHQMMI